MAATDDSLVEGADLLAQARTGSHDAFRALIEPYQAELRRHCYRMTGSVDDADDLLQETLFRAWRGLGTYVSYGSFRAWLYQIATRRTLDLLKSAPRRHEVINSANEPPWLQPFPHRSDSNEPDETVAELEMIGLAFIAALQNLPGRQRAALILRDVLGFSATETADILGCSVPAANSALQRARSIMAAIQPVDRVSATTDDQRAVAQRFLQAWRAADTASLVKLLHETIHMTMPPHPLEVFGALNTVDFLMDVSPTRSPDQLRFRPVAANGECGIAAYRYDNNAEEFKRHCIMFFESSPGSVRKITGFTEDRIFELLRLPKTVDP